MTKKYADLKTHKKTHQREDTSESELDPSVLDDVTDDILNSCDLEWKLERVDNFTPENVEQENHNSVGDFQDDEADVVMRDHIEIEVPRVTEKMKVPRDDQTKIQAENDQAQDGYESGNGDSVIAKVMSNKAFLGTKTRKSRKYSKVCINFSIKLV